MYIDFLRDKFHSAGDETALVWHEKAYSFRELLAQTDALTRQVEDIPSGAVVTLAADFSPQSIALLLALIDRSAIIVPQSNAVPHSQKDIIAEAEYIFEVNHADELQCQKLSCKAAHPHYATLRERRHPGLVLFSSGTSGIPKAAVHDLTYLLEKFRVPRTALSTLNFLLFDHWGGLNTMFHTLSNGAMLVTVQNRSPDAVCALIEQFRVALLPATPTFLNLLLLSGAHRERDLSSLRIITYGAEPMPQSTLDRLVSAFPGVKLQQTYGLIEVGVLRSKSRDDGSLWVRIGGEGYETRIVDGILQIRTPSTILGYLNAAAPLTEDGWFITGDAVLQEGDYVQILGRQSELINVGGEKVYPAEVESVIQTMEDVLEVTVFGERNPLIGNIVCAKIRVNGEHSASEISARVKRHCAERLERFKVPVKVQCVSEEQFGERFKKVRRPNHV